MPVIRCQGAASSEIVVFGTATYSLVYASLSICAIAASVRSRNAVAVARMSLQMAAALALLAPAMSARSQNNPPRASIVTALAALLMLAANASLRTLASYNIGFSELSASVPWSTTLVQTLLSLFAAVFCAPRAFEALSVLRYPLSRGRSKKPGRARIYAQERAALLNSLYLTVFLHAVTGTAFQAVDVLACTGALDESPLLLSILDLLSSVFALTIIIPPVHRISCVLLQAMTPELLLSVRSRLDSVTAIDGCLRVRRYNFWEQMPGVVQGTLALEVRPGVKANSIVASVNEIFLGVVDHLSVQVECAEVTGEDAVESDFGNDFNDVVISQLQCDRPRIDEIRSN